jgi:alpha-methylacyl-CoA racemase
MGPLAGKKIIEIGGIGPGPVCGMMLADMGGEVILVERKPTGESIAGPYGDPKFTIMNRGKKSIALDLKQEGAADIVLDLLRDADALLECFRPGVMERLGLGPLTGWGQSGPLSKAAGHDLNYVALSGALWYGGRADSPPVVPPTLVGDICGGTMTMTIGLLAGMLNAQATGMGQVIDAAVTDGSAFATTLLFALYEGGEWSRKRQDNPIDHAAHWYDTYETGDGKYVSLGSLEPKFYALLIDTLGLTDDPDFDRQFDKQKWPELKERFAEIFRSKTRDEWCEIMEGTDICFAPVLDFAEAPEQFIEVAGVTQPAPTPRFSRTVSAVASPPPEIGRDTDDVLSSLGYTERRLATLRDRGVI